MKQRAEKTLVAPSKLIPSTGGPRPAKTIMLCGVIQSIATYEAPVWASIMRMKKYRGMMVSLQRRGALRVIPAYQTVFKQASLVIAGTVP